MNDTITQIDTLLEEIYYMLDVLSNQLSEESKLNLLGRMKNYSGRMWDLVNLLAQTGHNLEAQAVFAPQDVPQTVITPDQLAQNDGRNGTPAYVAVNGTVYNMTDVPSWAAATHFGMMAGQDLTEEFLACHANQSIILSRMQEVGRLNADGNTSV